MEHETRLSLLHRLGGGNDQLAWTEFVRLYGPAIYRTVRYQGLQDADAQDVTQQVLMNVRRGLEQRAHDPSKARFRTWLSTVIRNATINAFKRQRPDRGTGDSEFQANLANIQETSSDHELLEREYQKQVFRSTAQAIEAEFEPHTWQAFWLTAVEGQEIEVVARMLSKPAGSIYTARSRVMKRLREEVQRRLRELEGESE